MRLLVHKKSVDSLIQLPVIMIAESELTPLEEILQTIPSELEPTIVNESEIPQDHTYIRAWDIQNGKVVIDIEKAREIKTSRLRIDRLKFLSDLDVAFQRALETGADTTGIVAKKQLLRDITTYPALLNAQTVEELDNITVESILED